MHTPPAFLTRPPRSPSFPGVLERPPVLVAFLVLLTLTVLSQLYGALVLGPAAARDLGAAPATADWVQPLFGASYAVGFLLWGPMVDKYGPRRCLLTGLAVLVTATVLVAAAPSMEWLLAGRVLQGAGAAGFAPSVFAYVGARLPGAVRMIAVTVLTSSFLAAAAIAQVSVQLVLMVGSWRWFFAASAVVLAAGWVVVAIAVRPVSPGAPAGGNPATVLVGLIRQRRVSLLLGATLAVLGPFVALYAALGLSNRYPDSELLMLRLSAVPALIWAGAASRWLIGVSPRARMLTAFAGGAAAALFLTFAGGTALGAGVGMFVLAACVSVLAPATIQALTALAPAQQGSVTTLYTFSLFLGASLAPLPVTALAGAVPQAALVNGTALLAVPCLLLALYSTALATRPQ